MRKLVLSILFILTMLSQGLAISFNDTQSLYIANERSGNLIDSGNHTFIGNLTQTGTVPSQTGHILGARGVYSGSYFSKAGLSLWSYSDSFTIAMWVRNNNTVTANNFLARQNGATGAMGYVLMYEQPTGSFVFKISNICSPYTCAPSVTQSLTTGNWYFIVATSNGATCKLSINNATYTENGVPSGGGRGSTIAIGAGDDSTSPATSFAIEQVSFWNTSLTQSEVNWLWNNGTGQNYTVVVPGNSTSIALNHPANDTVNTTSQVVDFSFTPTFYGGVKKNCSLMSNVTGAWGNSNITDTPNNGTATVLKLTMPVGKYLWGVSCSDELTTNYSSNRTLNISYLNYTSVQFNLPSVPFGEYANITAYVMDLYNGNSNLTTGTLILNYTDPRGISKLAAFTYSSGGLWYTNKLFFNALGNWVLNATYTNNETLPSFNETTLTISTGGGTPPSDGGGGGGISIAAPVWKAVKPFLNLTIIEPENNTITNSSPVRFSARVENNTPVDCALFFDNAEVSFYLENNTVSHTIFADSGEHTATLMCSNNETTEKAQVFFSVEKPKRNSTAPGYALPEKAGPITSKAASVFEDGISLGAIIALAAIILISSRKLLSKARRRTENLNQSQ